MIPFDGLFAQNYVYPFALGTYNATTPLPGYSVDAKTTFAIMADTTKVQAALAIPKLSVPSLAKPCERAGLCAQIKQFRRDRRPGSCIQTPIV